MCGTTTTVTKKGSCASLQNLEREKSLELSTSTLARLRSTNCATPADTAILQVLRHFGAGEESRTLDLNLGKVALYQLSYSRICTTYFAEKTWSGKRGSNSRPQPWQGCALPTELFPHQRKTRII